MQFIRQCYETNAVLYTAHARHEMRQEDFGEITDEEAYQAIFGGEVIEEYPDDKPYPSVLIFGLTQANRPIHLVCACDETGNRTIVVTVYQPDPQRWENFRRRKK